jgi:hypothetical protein
MQIATPTQSDIQRKIVAYANTGGMGYDTHVFLLECQVGGETVRFKYLRSQDSWGVLEVKVTGAATSGEVTLVRPVNHKPHFVVFGPDALPSGIWRLTSAQEAAWLSLRTDPPMPPASEAGIREVRRFGDIDDWLRAGTPLVGTMSAMMTTACQIPD